MALERFIPKSPDIFIRNSQDFEVAKFGHLNTIVEYINNNSAKPAGLNGYVQFNNNSALGGDAGLFWDNVNKRLGVGTVTPSSTLIVNGVTGITNSLYLGNTDSFLSTNRFQILNAGNTLAMVNVDGGGSISTTGRFQIFNSTKTNIAQAMYYDGATMVFRPMNDGVESTSFRNNAQTLNILNFNGVNGNVDLNFTGASLGAKLGIRGSGATSATTSLLVQNSAGSPLLSVLDDGSVGVGTITPSFYFDVKKTTAGTASLNIESQFANANAILRISDGNARNTSLQRRGDLVNGDFRILMNGSTKFIFTDSGKFGVTAANPPTAQFQVNGEGSTSATTSLLVQNSAGSESMRITDDRVVKLTQSSSSTALNVDFGNVNSNVKILSHGSSDFTQLQIGTNFSFSRNGAGDPTISTSLGLGIYTEYINFRQGDLTPPRLWMTGSYSRGSAYFGANNSGGVVASTLYFQNSETPTAVQNVLATFNLWAISDNTTIPTLPASSMFSLESTTRGFLPPRMTTAQRNAIASPANGLIVFDTDVQNLCYRRDGVWVQATFAAV